MDPFIAELADDDPTWGRMGEQPMAWLRRSTKERARRIRAFLNPALARLPSDARASIGTRLERQWQAAFFELIVGRVLQELGATVEYEAETESGSRIDWLATFPDGRVGVEATVPLINAVVGTTMRDQQPTLELIERVTPPGWNVIAVAVPATPGDAPRRPIRAVLRRWANELVRMDPPRQVEFIEEELPGGDLHLIYRPVAAQQVIQVYPGGSYMDDSKERIRWAVEGKKAQASGAPWPVLLAVQGSGLGTGPEDFDQALLGSTVDVLDRRRQRTEVRFEPRGVFGERRPEPPSLAGVLAFVDLGPLSGAEPVLYPHPRSPARLPDAFLALERRRYGGSGIEAVQRSGEPVMDRLGLAGR